MRQKSMACTELKALEIIDQLYSTDTVVSVLRRNQVDNKSFFKLVATVPLITENYIRAQGIRADLFADMVVEESRSLGDANQTRNRMNALIWAASKMKPDKYGDRIDVNLNQTLDIRGALDEAKNRIRDIIIQPKLITNSNQTTSIDAQSGSQPVSEPVEFKNDIDELLS